MNRHPDFVMHYKDSSHPLNDIFIHSDSPESNPKPSDITGSTRSQTDSALKLPSVNDPSFHDGSSVTDSFIDMHLLGVDPIKTSCIRTLTGHISVLPTFPRDSDAFSFLPDPIPEAPVLCDSSPPVRNDQQNEDTGFSGYFSETRVENDKENDSQEPHTEDEGASEGINSPESLPKFLYRAGAPRKEVQKPPTTAGIKLDHLKAVFHLERPKAEKKLGLRRTTFSNLSRHYGISKWPFRTIRDALNRMAANKRLLDSANVSKERRRKLQRQQRLLHDVIDLIYKDPRHSRDSNTLAVLLMIVAAKDNQ